MKLNNALNFINTKEKEKYDAFTQANKAPGIDQLK